MSESPYASRWRTGCEPRVVSSTVWTVGPGPYADGMDGDADGD